MKLVFLSRTIGRTLIRSGSFVVLAVMLIQGEVQAEPATPTPPPLTSLEGIVALIPSSVNLRVGSTYSATGIKQAEDAIVLQANGEPAALRLKVETLEPTKNYGFDYQIAAVSGTVNSRGVAMNYHLWVYFKEDKTNVLAKVRPGNSVIVVGMVNRVNIVMEGGKPTLRLDLDDGNIYNSMDAATAALATLSHPAPAGSAKTGTSTPGAAQPALTTSAFGSTRPVATAAKEDLVGTWELDTAEPGSEHYTMQVRADGTWSWDRNFSGTWTVSDGYFNLRFNEHDNFLDRYELPVRNGELHGVNGVGGKLFMRRKPTAAGAGTPNLPRLGH